MFTDLLRIADATLHGVMADTPAVYRPAVGDPIAIMVVWNNQTLEQKPIEMRQEVKAPMVWLRLADIAPHDPRTDDAQVEISGVLYRILKRAHDGDLGETVQLRLQRA